MVKCGERCGSWMIGRYESESDIKIDNYALGIVHFFGVVTCHQSLKIPDSGVIETLSSVKSTLPSTMSALKNDQKFVNFPDSQSSASMSSRESECYSLQ